MGAFRFQFFSREPINFSRNTGRLTIHPWTMTDCSFCSFFRMGDDAGLFPAVKIAFWPVRTTQKKMEVGQILLKQRWCEPFSIFFGCYLTKCLGKNGSLSRAYKDTQTCPDIGKTYPCVHHFNPQIIVLLSVVLSICVIFFINGEPKKTLFLPYTNLSCYANH